MSIDWITVAAQIANFLVLVWLLKRFLYRPILDGIDAREAEIATRMDSAVAAKAKAEAVEAAFEEKMRALNAAQSEMEETVRKAAEAQRDALLADAQLRMEQEHTNWQAHQADEARKFAASLHSAGASAVLQVTRKALTDLADQTLEARMAQHLMQQIQPMIADLGRAVGQAKTAVLTSHDPMLPAAQSAVMTALQAQFPDVQLRFETDAAQAPGLMLRMGGAQVAWTVDSYIDGLDALVADQLATTQSVSGMDQKAQPK
ncbi:F0F1 ATP synthase subunit B [Pseudorhodobacter sp. W20_MBD10_FR17]|uniref:F0F1 ATP synthase subunit B family protein n=1 Tax=Pseudorhodobacter sp. W20_MBD10_FR17 TaxID=3240266 RepID=UPI003F9C2B7D